MEYPTLPPTSEPLGITAGADGNIWATDYARVGPSARTIWKMNTSGVVLANPSVSANLYPYGITSGPDGNLWVAAFTRDGGGTGSGAIERLNTDGNVIGVYAIPDRYNDSSPIQITVGPDGYIWFTGDNFNETGQGYVARINPFSPDDGIQFFRTIHATRLFGITAGPDGNIWFTSYASHSSVGKVDLSTPNYPITEYPVDDSRFPFGITAGPDGNIWFVENHGNDVRIISGRVLLALRHRCPDL